MAGIVLIDGSRVSNGPPCFAKLCEWRHGSDGTLLGLSSCLKKRSLLQTCRNLDWVRGEDLESPRKLRFDGTARWIKPQGSCSRRLRRLSRTPTPRTVRGSWTWAAI